MKLSIEAISDFKVIYKNHFGVDLIDEEANQKGLELLDFFRFIYRKVPIQDVQTLRLLDPEYRAS